MPNDSPVEQPIARSNRELPGYIEGQGRLPNTSDSSPPDVARFDPTSQPTIAGSRIERPVEPGVAVQLGYNVRFAVPVRVDVGSGSIMPVATSGLQPGEPSALLPRAAE